MDRLRAEEIAQSPDLKHVTFNGAQVYIQNVDKQKQTARVFPLDDPQKEIEVQLASLYEKNNL